jgi:hypothetical protein
LSCCTGILVARGTCFGARGEFNGPTARFLLSSCSACKIGGPAVPGAQGAAVGACPEVRRGCKWLGKRDAPPWALSLGSVCGVWREQSSRPRPARCGIKRQHAEKEEGSGVSPGAVSVLARWHSPEAVGVIPSKSKPRAPPGVWSSAYLRAYGRDDNV